ncbi:MAG: hypothetical protein KIH69_016445 [Anaerolineae bacterium]|nr:hypothetical protein [Anaerolineae bacterium]
MKSKIWPSVRRFGVMIGFVGVLAACATSGQPLSNVTVSPAQISPNADGKEDIARISYKVGVPMRVSIYLTDAAGQRYDLRRDEPRNPSPQAYEYLFSGVANGKLLPNGDYTWHVDGSVDGQPTQSSSGTLKITDVNTPFPEIRDFTVSTNVFSPNRDAIDDRVYINLYLTQRANLNVYVESANGYRYEVPRREGNVVRAVTDNDTRQVIPGRYQFDFDGGIDLGADPPDDGQYVLVAQSEDQIGQRHVLTAPITVRDSGRPVAEIVTQPSSGNGVDWSQKGPSVKMVLSDTLYFTTTVRNIGKVPLRTAGPFDNADCYRMNENWYSKGFKEEPGVWRIGINFESNAGADHPWRWAVGGKDQLDVVMSNGQPLYYLGVGKQVEVRGCIKLTKVPARNPFYVWASLIQEEVEIVNRSVTPLQIELIEK